MGNPKEELLQLVEKLPNDVSHEDIQYHIYVQQAVERGLDAADRGRRVSQDEVERWMAKWLDQ